MEASLGADESEYEQETGCSVAEGSCCYPGETMIPECCLQCCTAHLYRSNP